MDNGSILYIPIQINGDGATPPESLLDRELYVLDNGTLYVGRKQADGTVVPQTIMGRVVDNAIINNPTLKGSIKLGEGIVRTVAPAIGNPGEVFFVDEGNFDPDKQEDMSTLQRMMENVVTRVDILEKNGSSGTTRILTPTLEENT